MDIMVENPQRKKEESAAEEKSEEEKRVEQEGKSKIVDTAREVGERIVDRTRELFGSDGGLSEQHGKAAKRMERLKFGGSILGAGLLLALAGTIALPFWGMKKILQADKDFMKGFNLLK